jgi:lipopolysaccharide transport system permease protein
MSITVPHRLHPARRDFILDFQPGGARLARSQLAWADLTDGLRLWRLAATLGWLDIKLRYRGSLLGPFWLTLSTGVMVGSLGLLYAELFKIDVREYLPFLALSQVLWAFMSSMVGDGCTCFTSSDSVIRSVRMPFTVHALRSLVRNVLVLGHNILVIVVVYAALSVWPGWRAVLALPGVAVWAVDGVAVSLLFGAFCARFRDIPPIVGSLMQIAFFVTPIIWTPKQLGPNEHWLLVNPFFDLLELVREPLLGSTAGMHVWWAALAFSAILCGLSWLLFAPARGRIAFWV